MFAVFRRVGWVIVRKVVCIFRDEKIRNRTPQFHSDVSRFSIADDRNVGKRFHGNNNTLKKLSGASECTQCCGSILLFSSFLYHFGDLNKNIKMC